MGPGITGRAGEMSNKSTDGDISVLHGTRGFLALWVLLGHTTLLSGAHIPVLESAGTAVMAFMLISGLLMAHQFRSREENEPWDQPRTWLMFYTRRFFRIAPVYYLALAISFAFHGWLMPHYYALYSIFPSGFVQHSHGAPAFDFAGLISHITFVFGVIPTYANNNVLPDWSIGLEMQFYFAFPFLMLFYAIVGPLWMAMAAVVASIFAARYSPVYPQPSFLPLMIVPFVIGILTSEARREENKLKAAACFGLAIFLSYYQPHRLFEYVSLLIICIIILPPVFPFLRVGFLGSIADKVLCGEFGRYIGDRSYSLYLIHMLVLVPLLTTFSYIPWMLDASTPVRAIIASCAMLAICFPLSGLLYAYIEQPMIKVGRAVVRSMRASYYEAPASHSPIQGEGVRVARSNN